MPQFGTATYFYSAMSALLAKTAFIVEFENKQDSNKDEARLFRATVLDVSQSTGASFQSALPFSILELIPKQLV